MTVFAHKARVEEFFRINGTVAPNPQFAEELPRYRQRVLSCAQSLLPQGHVWGGVNIGKMDESALDSIERMVMDDQVAAYKAPVGPLRELTEQCPRTGRTITRFYGDPENVWAPFKGVTQRVVGFTQAGRGADSPQAREAAAASAAEMRAAYSALERERSAAGLR